MRTIVYLLLIVNLFSCGNKNNPDSYQEAKNIADGFCNCLHKNGFKSPINSALITFSRDSLYTNCKTKSMKKIKKWYVESGKNKEIFKELYQAFLDTDCAQTAFESIPYDNLIEILKKVEE